MNGFAWLTEALPWKSEGRRKQRRRRRRRRGDVGNQSLICIPPVNAMPSTTYRINLNHLKLRKRTRQVNISSSRVMTWPFYLTMEITCHYLIGWRAMWLCRFTQVRIDLTIDLGRAWWFEAILIFYYKILLNGVSISVNNLKSGACLLNNGRGVWFLPPQVHCFCWFPYMESSISPCAWGLTANKEEEQRTDG